MSNTSPFDSDADSTSRPLVKRCRKTARKPLKKKNQPIQSSDSEYEEVKKTPKKFKGIKQSDEPSFLGNETEVS